MLGDKILYRSSAKNPFTDTARHGILGDDTGWERRFGNGGVKSGGRNTRLEGNFHISKAGVCSTGCKCS